MITIGESFSKIIISENIRKDGTSKAPMERDIDDLIDLIKIRLSDKTIVELADSVLETVFELRLKVVEWFAKNGGDINHYFEEINHLIAKNLNLANYSKLADTVANLLIVHEKIIAPIIEKSTLNGFGDISEIIESDKPSYNTIKLMSLLPSPQAIYLKRWIDASLHLDVALIIADLILIGQIKLSKKRIKDEIIPFLTNTITKYGAYAMFLGLWQAPQDDENPFINKMSILSATIELDNNKYHKTTKNGFFDLVNN